MVFRLGSGLLREIEDDYIAKAKAVVESRLYVGEINMSAYDTLKDYLLLEIADKAVEIFGVLHLDNENRLLSDDIIFTGTIDTCPVYPRVLLQRALALNARGVIIYHNHPGGLCVASPSDHELTKRLKKVYDIVDISLHDHFLIAGMQAISFCEQGWL